MKTIWNWRASIYSWAMHRRRFSSGAWRRYLSCRRIGISKTKSWEAWVQIECADLGRNQKWPKLVWYTRRASCPKFSTDWKSKLRKTEICELMHKSWSPNMRKRYWSTICFPCWSNITKSSCKISYILRSKITKNSGSKSTHFQNGCSDTDI